MKTDYVVQYQSVMPGEERDWRDWEAYGQPQPAFDSARSMLNVNPNVRVVARTYTEKVLEFPAIQPGLTKGQTVNEEQKAWVESVKKFIADAELNGEGYEQIVDGIQEKLDTCPEP